MSIDINFLIYIYLLGISLVRITMVISSEEELDEDEDLQTEYNKLFSEYIKFLKIAKKSLEI